MCGYLSLLFGIFVVITKNHPGSLVVWQGCFGLRFSVDKEKEVELVPITLITTTIPSETMVDWNGLFLTGAGRSNICHAQFKGRTFQVLDSFVLELVWHPDIVRFLLTPSNITDPNWNK